MPLAEVHQHNEIYCITKIMLMKQEKPFTYMPHVMIVKHDLYIYKIYR